MRRDDWSLFAGNERSVAAVQTMLREGRVPQALVIEGPAGSGKKTLARRLAAGLLCRNGAPCFDCSVCDLVLSDHHPDVIPITAEKDKSAIGVGAIRKVRGDAYLLPQQSDRKVFIIADPMNVEAQNALLKVLEEPPARVVFILLCEHHSSLIPTVLSRVTVITLGGVTYEQAEPVLERLGYPLGNETREKLEACQGLIGKLLQSDEGESLARQVATACGQALARGKREEFLQAVTPVVGERALHSEVLAALSALVRDALRCTVTGAGDGVALQLSRRLTREQLLAAGELLAAGQEKIIYNPNGGLFFTALCAQLFPRQ
ncbi:MAG: DNA polymerase III subunit [Clostridia bacterium]|nr:DNA polymerase III subunit [Clostridia bacterium]